MLDFSDLYKEKNHHFLYMKYPNNKWHIAKIRKGFSNYEL